MTDMVCRDYAELIAALKARMAELGVTMETLDDISGLPTRYVSKIFSPTPLRGLGRVSLGPLIGALGLKLIVAEDAEQLARIRSRLIQRKARAHIPDEPMRHAAKMPSVARHLVVTTDFLRKIGAQGGIARANNMTRRRLAQIGRMGAVARWSK
jgi:hypothetical protein